MITSEAQDDVVLIFRGTAAIVTKFLALPQNTEFSLTLNSIAEIITKPVIALLLLILDFFNTFFVFVQSFRTTYQEAIETDSNDAISKYLRMCEFEEGSENINTTKLLCMGNQRNGQVSLPIAPNLDDLNPKTDAGTEVAIWIIRTNIVQTIIKLVCICQERYQAFDTHNDKYNNKHFQVLAKYRYLLSYDNFENHNGLNLNDNQTLEKLYLALEYIWDLPSIKTVFNANNGYNPNYNYNYENDAWDNRDWNINSNSNSPLDVPFWMVDNMEHYLNDLQRIFSNDYIPTQDDVNKCKRVCIKMDDCEKFSMKSMGEWKYDKKSTHKLRGTSITGNFSMYNLTRISRIFTGV